MRFPIVPTALALGAVAALTFSLASAQKNDADEMAEMMKKAGRYMKPGENHEVLERFLGKWNTEATIFMPGAKPEVGTAEFSWLMPGLFLQARSHGSMMGMPMEGYYLIGYDNYKMSFVTTAVSSVETAMRHFEGDLTPDGKAIISYGTVDEYLTGEHDKMAKSMWRFLDADTIVHEVHDLPIGETNTKVFEVKYTRAK